MDWLYQLLDKILSVIPRLWIINPDELGVRVTPKLWNGWPWNRDNIDGGVWVKELMPGWHIIWFLVQNAEKVKVKTQIVDLPAQSAWTRDGQEVIISGALRYHLTSAKKALFKNFDHDKNIQTLALGVIHDFIAEKTLQELVTSARKELKSEILQGLKEDSKGWGIAIEKVYLTDTGKVINYRVLGNHNAILPIQE